MVSVVILDNHEPKVMQLTFENLYSELKDIPGSELLIKTDWFDLSDIKNRYVCFVEADCLVSPGYFKAQLEGFSKRGYSLNMAVMSSTTAVKYWDNKIYGYKMHEEFGGVLPNKIKRSSNPFAVQIAYIPGSIIRMSMLKTCMKDFMVPGLEDDLVYLSTALSMALWHRSAKSDGKGYRIYLNPKATYVTTEEYVNDMGNFNIDFDPTTENLFKRESI